MTGRPWIRSAIPRFRQGGRGEWEEEVVAGPEAPQNQIELRLPVPQRTRPRPRPTKRPVVFAPSLFCVAEFETPALPTCQLRLALILVFLRGGNRRWLGLRVGLRVRGFLIVLRWVPGVERSVNVPKEHFPDVGRPLCAGRYFGELLQPFLLDFRFPLRAELSVSPRSRSFFR